MLFFQKTEKISCFNQQQAAWNQQLVTIFHSIKENLMFKNISDRRFEKLETKNLSSPPNSS